MQEDKVILSRENYDKLELFKRIYHELQDDISNINNDFISEGKSIGLKQIYTEIGYGYTKIDYYSNDEVLKKICGDLSTLKKKHYALALKLDKIPTWLRRIFKAD